jgi:hypothetical protein
MSKTTRPRGFAEWTPSPASMALIDAVSATLLEYEEYLPLTLRQIFYRLVSKGVLDKSENTYQNQLIEKVGRARRAQLLPMDAFRDDGFAHKSITTYGDAEDVVDMLDNIASHAAVNRQQGQDRRLMLWCEAQGMLPQLERVGRPYGVESASSGGFDSITTKHAMAEAFSAEPTLVLHIGDHDPSGVHMFSSLEEDVMAFTGHYSGEVDFLRIAVTPDHVDAYGLPTAPPKKTDKRSFTGLTTQAEALRPDVLATIMEQAIKDNMDLDQYEHMLEVEQAMQDEVLRRLKKDL